MAMDLHLQHPNIMTSFGSNAERQRCRLQRITAFFCSLLQHVVTLQSEEETDGHLNTIYATTVVYFLQDNNNKALLFVEATSRSGEGTVI
jgi:hypothetical protein